MENEIKNPENENPKPGRNETVHGTLLACGGGYTVYMAYQMIYNTKNGLSTMSMTTTAVLASILAIGGAAVLGFGLYLMYRDYKKQK